VLDVDIKDDTAIKCKLELARLAFSEGRRSIQWQIEDLRVFRQSVFGIFAINGLFLTFMSRFVWTLGSTDVDILVSVKIILSLVVLSLIFEILLGILIIKPREGWTTDLSAGVIIDGYMNVESENELMASYVDLVSHTEKAIENNMKKLNQLDWLFYALLAVFTCQLCLCISIPFILEKYS
jgi:hypothetical protein